MSLSKQLLILVSALFLLLFSMNFFVSVSSIRDYLQGEAAIHAQDTATSLGLSLSPYLLNPQDSTIKTMTSAIFDMGYYQEIRLVDKDGIDLVQLTSDKSMEGVPTWFIDYFPMIPATASSEISSGWNISGVIHVTVHPGHAYIKLYTQAKTALSYSLASFAASLLFLSLILRITLASLKKIDQLAEAVAEGHFETIDELPWTTEVKNLATSMNIMSRKIQVTFNGLNKKLETLGANLLRDDLTGLYKKSALETDIKQLLMGDKTAFFVLIKIDSLADLAKAQDSHTIDQYLQNFAQLLQNTAERSSLPPSKIYRFYGAEFAILVKNSGLEQLEALLQRLSIEFAEFGKQYQQADVGHIGVVSIDPTDTIEQILDTSYEAYEQAQLIGANSYFIHKGNHVARDISQWKNLVFDYVDNARYSLAYTGQIIHFQSGKLLLEETFIEVRDEHENPVATAPFIAIAEKCNKITDLDKNIIVKALAHIRDDALTHALAVNLSTQSIKNIHFRLWLENLLKQNRELARQLVFSLSAYAVTKDVEVYQEFIDAMHRWGCQVMIKRLESLSLSPEILKRLKPDYIRLARDLVNNIGNDRKKHDFVQALQEMAVLLDILVLAENVGTDSDLNTLKTIGIAGASR